MRLVMYLINIRAGPVKKGRWIGKSRLDGQDLVNTFNKGSGMWLGQAANGPFLSFLST